MTANAPFDRSLGSFIKRLRIHSPIADEDADAIRTLPCRVLRLRQNSQLVREGDLTDRCVVLVSGFMHRFRFSEDGRRQILSLYVPGDPVDFDHLFLPVADDGLQALRDSLLASIAHSDLRKLMRERPAVADAITRALQVDSSIFREWILNVGQRDARARIAHLLCEISARLQAQDFDFENIPLPLTQDQIADATGLSSIHVNRTLKVLNAEKWIERRGALVMLPNPDALRELAGFDARYLHLDA
ncbi:MAG: Crp/Fnr family transcriptional regulator [Sphingomonas sp.]|nr:Crp/Fnr family transcriptional regulator [Sphingomonas sp.]